MKRKIKKALEQLKRIYARIRSSINKDEQVDWLSLGENCLSDDILKRFYLKTYSSFYASARSNIDYNLSMHKNSYTGLFDAANTIYGLVGNDKVLRSSRYNASDAIYHSLHSNGVEFTHHDWISEPENKVALMRRLQRMHDRIGKIHCIFLYHHRFTEKSNIPLLISKLNEFRSFFESDGKKCFIILFYQQQIDDRRKRKISFIGNHSGVLEFSLNTLHLWEGTDQRIFWARNDNDLLRTMLRESKMVIKREISTKQTSHNLSKSGLETQVPS